jgi:pimeloyl-ACP methyl ester carboxylesterase
MKTVVYIHGANATGESFNFIREHIKHRDIVLEYNSANGFSHNLQDLYDRIKHEEKIFFVAHSLGGVYALHLADKLKKQVYGAVTLSTPYGGSREADVAKLFFPFSRLMRDIGPHACPMRKTREIEINVPWTNVVTTRGASIFIPESNDGVVTLDSMRHCAHSMTLIEMPLNHYEVVLSEKVVKLISENLDT